VEIRALAEPSLADLLDAYRARTAAEILEKDAQLNK